MGLSLKVHMLSATRVQHIRNEVPSFKLTGSEQRLVLVGRRPAFLELEMEFVSRAFFPR